MDGGTDIRLSLSETKDVGYKSAANISLLIAGHVLGVLEELGRYKVVCADFRHDSCSANSAG